MSETPENLQYTETHEWVRVEEDHVVTIGVTDHAQHLLGDIVFVDLPLFDVDVSADDEVAVIESVKTAADVYAPLDGHIIEINEALTVTPEIINQDPYGTGWLLRLKINDMSKLDDLLDAQSYAEMLDD